MKQLVFQVWINHIGLYSILVYYTKNFPFLCRFRKFKQTSKKIKNSVSKLFFVFLTFGHFLKSCKSQNREAPHLRHQLEKKSCEGTLIFHGKIELKKKLDTLFFKISNFHPIFACEASKYMFFGVLNPFLTIKIDFEQYLGPYWGGRGAKNGKIP